MAKSSADLPPVEGTVVGSHPTHRGTNDTVVIDGTPLYGEEWEDPEKKRFVMQGYKDVWAGVVFVGVLLCVFVIGTMNLANPHKTSGVTNEGDSLASSTATKLATYAPIALFVSVLLACASVWCMKKHPRAYIIVANVVMIVLNALVAISLLAAKIWVLGALYSVGVVIHIIWFMRVQDRIPFSALLLKTSATLTARHWGMVVVSFGGLLAGTLFMFLWCAAVLPNLTVTTDSSGSDHNDDTKAASGAIAFVYMLVLYWGAQVVFNVVHVTASGTIATWYFVGEERMPSNPTAPNLKRAMTSSFGSICLGSFIVALLKLLYRMARDGIRHMDHELVRCILALVVGILEWLTELFNIYAFTHVAVYGSDFVTAAKQTWALVKDCGWAVVFNDALVWPVMSLTNFLAALFLGVSFGLASGDSVVGLVAAFIAWVVFIVLLRPVYSAIATQFVCVAECPEAMQTANPLYHAAMLQAMPPQSDQATQAA